MGSFIYMVVAWADGEPIAQAQLEVFVYPKAYLWLEQNRTYSGGIVCKAQLRLKPYGETLADVGFDTCGRPRLKIVGLSLRSIARSH